MNTLRDLPSVDRLVTEFSDCGLPREILLTVARTQLDQARTAISQGQNPGLVSEQMGKQIGAFLSSRISSVINGTGVLLHTNLGRAVWSDTAADQAHQVATAYANLEIDLNNGQRGKRGQYLHLLLTELAGSEAAMVVNNNAAALLLALAALAPGKPVPVSRGELIEIGGSYRLPELIAATGAHMVEIGTTNRTHLSDYRQHIEHAALLLKVHPSNYRVEGFVTTPEVSELAELAHQFQKFLIFDVGSGLLDAEAPWLSGPPPAWLRSEPGVRQSLVQGADLVLFSGDKLLGGPQAGIIVGRSELIDKLRSHPLARALRTDAVTVAALTSTLEAYADGRVNTFPFWQMATTTSEVLEQRARHILSKFPIGGEMVTSQATIGAGSVPGSVLESRAIQLCCDDIDYIYRQLLQTQPPVVSHRHQGRLLVDLRTVFAEQDHELGMALSSV